MAREDNKTQAHLSLSRPLFIVLLTGDTQADPNDPDYEPSLYMGHGDDGGSIQKAHKRKSRHERNRRRATNLERKQQQQQQTELQEREEVHQGAQILMDLINSCVNITIPGEQEPLTSEKDKKLGKTNHNILKLPAILKLNYSHETTMPLTFRSICLYLQHFHSCIKVRDQKLHHGRVFIIFSEIQYNNNFEDEYV